jgi:nucleotide-binding universal stress UspA family protein
LKILLAVDDSQFSEAATQAVIAQHQSRETEVKVLHVLDRPHFVDVAFPMPSSYEEIFRQESQKQAEALVAKTAEQLRANGLEVTTAVEQGDPKSRIVDNAVQWQADLVVLGSHGRKGLNRFLIGSVAEAVARHAPCSVQIVRTGSAV